MAAHLLLAVLTVATLGADPAPKVPRDAADLEAALVRAKGNRKELDKALASVPAEQRTAMEFLIRNMRIAMCHARSPRIS
ncbi:MAG: hypothetical protein U0744_08950 [Gemmataceae bacterium]